MKQDAAYPDDSEEIEDPVTNQVENISCFSKDPSGKVHFLPHRSLS